MRLIHVQLMLSLACALPVAGPLGAQPKPAAGAEQATIKAGSEEVLLDIVVRDKKGKTVRDLSQRDVEVTDNGQPVQIKSFRLVEGAEAISGGAGAGGHKVPLDPMRQMRLVTLVFERLGDEGRRLAQQATLELLKNDLGQNVFYSVFSIDRRLSALQPFTNDRDLIRKAVEHATSGAYTQFGEESQQIRSRLEQQLGAHAGNSLESKLQDMASSTGDHGAPSNAVAAIQARMMLDMMQMDEKATNDDAGRATLYALLSLVRGQSLLPGRKTVVYFTQGLSVPKSMDEQFRSVISVANRSNVSLYPVDARGLISGRQSERGSSDLAGAADSSRRQALSGGRGAVTPDEVTSGDRAEQSIRGNVQSALLELADNTGGALIANTNDLRGPLRKLSEDINSYYELTYDPHIQNYNGSLRRITVKTARGDLKVQTRNGYFALPPSEGNISLLPYEVPLLKALDTKPLPRTFDFRAGGLLFGSAGDGTRCELVLELPLKNVTFTEDKATNAFHGRVSMVALVKDKNGAIVQRLSKDQPVQVPADKLAGLQAGTFTYLEKFVLQPGRYTLEAAVNDTEGNRVSARKSVLLVPVPPPGVSLSSVALVRRFEPDQKQVDPQNPFAYRNGIITPTLNDVLPAGKDSMVSIFLVVYPDPKAAEAPKLAIQYVKEGKVVGRLEPTLPAADSTGKIAYVASASAESMPPGDYEIETIVKQGAGTAVEKTGFTIQ